MGENTSTRLTIGEIRRRAYLTQAEFADRVGVTPLTVHNWEYGVFKPSLKNIRLIAEKFGLRPDQIEVNNGE